MAFRRLWEGDEWQRFALKLIQLRHGAANVQVIPDKVKGDAGLECFSLDGCLYQCYAPEEVSDIQKAATAMRTKASRDLNKLSKNSTMIAGLLQAVKAKRWILLCPFLDDKDVVAKTREKGTAVKGLGLAFVDPNFEALVHCQDDFQAEFETLQKHSLGPAIKIPPPSPGQVTVFSGGPMAKTLGEKLRRGFGRAETEEQIERRLAALIKAHLHRANTLETMRSDHPELWERALRCIQVEEDTLVAFGAGSDIPTLQLKGSLDRILSSLSVELPHLSPAMLKEIAFGTVSEWLVRCPLDFPAQS